jgi:hypothetical protein
MTHRGLVAVRPGNSGWAQHLGRGLLVIDPRVDNGTFRTQFKRAFEAKCPLVYTSLNNVAGAYHLAKVCLARRRLQAGWREQSCHLN